MSMKHFEQKSAAMMVPFEHFQSCLFASENDYYCVPDGFQYRRSTVNFEGIEEDEYVANDVRAMARSMIKTQSLRPILACFEDVDGVLPAGQYDCAGRLLLLIEDLDNTMWEMVCDQEGLMLDEDFADALGGDLPDGDDVYALRVHAFLKELKAARADASRVV